MKLYMKTQGSVIFGVVTSSKNTRCADYHETSTCDVYDWKFYEVRNPGPKAEETVHFTGQ